MEITGTNDGYGETICASEAQRAAFERRADIESKESSCCLWARRAWDNSTICEAIGEDVQRQSACTPTALIRR